MKDGKDKGSVIIPYGRTRISDFSEHMMSAALVGSFKGRPDAPLILDSNPKFQAFKAACAAWAIDKGYMEVTRVAQGDQEQVTLVEFTPKGKEELLGRRNQAS